VVSTGAEALAAVHEETFDCVVLDLRLPDMSGFDVLEKFRDTPALSDLPVVVFTGRNCRQTKMRGCIAWRAAWW